MGIEGALIIRSCKFIAFTNQVESWFLLFVLLSARTNCSYRSKKQIESQNHVMSTHLTSRRRPLTQLNLDSSTELAGPSCWRLTYPGGFLGRAGSGHVLLLQPISCSRSEEKKHVIAALL